MTLADLAERTVDTDEIARLMLAAHRDRTGLGEVSPDRVSTSTWTPASARKVRRRTFVRLDVDGEPVSVAKIPLSRTDPKLAHEFDVLRSFQPPSPLGCPAPLDALGDGFTMTYLPGVDLPTAVTGVDTPELLWRVLRPAVDRVVELHTAGPAVTTTPELALQTAAHYVRTPEFGVKHADDALRTALLAPTHGDLGPWNVRCDPAGGTARVLDFEDYRSTGIAAMDVVNLLVTTALAVFPDYQDHDFDWLYDKVFDGEHWFGSVLARGLVHYATHTGQQPGRVLDLLPFTCQWLIERIEAEGRDTSRLFYRPFLERYLERRPSVLGSNDV
ncbi:phosphotransferase [Lentzea sp. HUAS12]|uniref:phosphotransferase n=1 Tax=Lentzea sp. HUAS12 TaxID=2951806 RepID=UPI00209D05E5|nr:phosphotransferase [Lentzea sp. HUAS12]USX53383.1 aminoglycoside phosphotransferase family protein [Lentzea sp. HUAS12]